MLASLHEAAGPLGRGSTLSEAFDFTRRLRTVSDRDAPRLREHFLAPAEAFDAATLGDHLCFPLEMTWFYGEPVFEELGEAGRLLLNRLSFCQSYYSTAVAEAATNVLNYEAALRTFVRGDTDRALYMAREVLEETTHIEAFLLVVRKILAHHGLALADLHRANVSLPMAGWFVRAHGMLGWLRGDFDFYYFTRFALNVNQKTVERCAIDEPRMHPVVRELLKSHAIDEARHMQMSRATGIAAIAGMRPLARRLACEAFGHFAASLFIGRHRRDSRPTRETRTRTLELCGVPRARAERAYAAWRDRVHQPEDPPLVRAGRKYYWKQMAAYVDALDVPASVRARTKRVIGRAYADALAPEAADGVRALELEELARSS
jgi:hypothetical protein